jgi:NADH-quinone oxidoreductase subunit C
VSDEQIKRGNEGGQTQEFSQPPENGQSAPQTAGEHGGTLPAGKTDETPSTPPEPRAAENKAEAQAAGEEGKAKVRAVRGEKAKEGASDQPEGKAPSPNQPKLDRLVRLIKEHVAEEAVEEAYINELDRHLPCVVIKSEHWLACAKFLKDGELKLNYLRNVSGVDRETHMEVVYHLLSLDTKEDYCVKVKTDRDQPSVPSVTPVWQTANWNEREIYDLLGIDFPGHPDLRRIMLPDDWVGHPLRKDYQPIDPEV